MAETFYSYLAYGSNLCLQQMYKRCPDSILLGTGFLKDAELSFKGYNGRNACFATVDNKKGKRVPVGIFLVSKENMLCNLDRYEGFPIHYRRQLIAPERISIKTWYFPDVRLGKSWIYIMNNAYYGLPCKSYYDTCATGYSDCGLDNTYLRKAYEKSFKEWTKTNKYHI